MKRVAALTAVVVLLGYGVAGAGFYSADWNTDPGEDLGGWSDAAGGGAPIEMSWSADGGVGDTGHLKAYRGATYPPYMNTANDPVKSATGGDVNANYGPVLTISLDTMLEECSDSIGYGWWIFDTAGGFWYINYELPGELPQGEWRHYSTGIDTTWTDAEANAAGFINLNSPSSWADLMTHVQEWNFSGRAINYKGGGPYAPHLDNFVMATIPEPSALVLLAAGLMGLLVLRRRK